MRTIGLTTLCFVGGFFAGATFVFAIGMLLAVVFAIDGPYEALLQKHHLSVEKQARAFPGRGAGSLRYDLIGGSARRSHTLVRDA